MPLGVEEEVPIETNLCNIWSDLALTGTHYNMS